MEQKLGSRDALLVAPAEYGKCAILKTISCLGLKDLTREGNSASCCNKNKEEVSCIREA